MKNFLILLLTCLLTLSSAHAKVWVDSQNDVNPADVYLGNTNVADYINRNNEFIVVLQVVNVDTNAFLALGFSGIDLPAGLSFAGHV